MLKIVIAPDAQSQKVISRLIKSADAAQFLKSVYTIFDQEASRTAGYIIKNKLSGDPLKRRTGSLARAIFGTAILRDGLPALKIGVLNGPARAYAGIQELGGRIVPVRAKALAMPVGDALTPAGVGRWPSPRNYPGRLSFMPFRNTGQTIGALYDAQRPGKFLWLLMRWVDIKATHFMRDGVREYAPVLRERILQAVKELVVA